MLLDPTTLAAYIQGGQVHLEENGENCPVSFDNFKSHSGAIKYLNGGLMNEPGALYPKEMVSHCSPFPSVLQRGNDAFMA